ncbi:MAG: redoxin domain-containing protein [Candidatus Yonathbacteria bacterium]|nr:redoxin domain-containing protein [Candidatus Yonathbacteria bacterium]
MLPELTFEAYQKGEIINVDLGALRGRWLAVVFYPADFTFVCPTELSELANLYPEFQKEGAEVLSISTDTVYTHKAWHDTSDAIKKITFPMVADPAGKLARLLNVYIPQEGVTLRGSFIINPEGTIISMEVNDNSIGRSGKELLRKLRAAKFVAEHKGQVCPASWEPGGDTLTPGLDLVGKI